MRSESDHMLGSSQVHLHAIERVIQMMRARLHEPLILDDLAALAHLSPFHFSRVFRHVTGTPPGEFLAALRLEAAKHLLLTTSLSVTQVCHEVGYASLGSFTTRFTQLVGVPPSLLRRIADDTALTQIGDLAHGLRGHTAVAAGGRQLTVELQLPDQWRGTVCVGLFPKPLPLGFPVACAWAAGRASVRLGPAPEGRYYLLAAAIAWSDDPRAYLLPGSDMLVGTGTQPVVVRRGLPLAPRTLSMRKPCITDPPILSVLPLLLARFGIQQ